MSTSESTSSLTNVIPPRPQSAAIQGRARMRSPRGAGLAASEASLTSPHIGSTARAPPTRTQSAVSRASNNSQGSRRPVSYERLAAIAKPVSREYSEISGSFEDIKHCTFQPHISKTSKALAAATTSTNFLERLEGYTNHYHQARNATPEPSSDWTFKPQIHSRRKQSESESSGDNVGTRLARYSRRALTDQEVLEEQKRLHPDWTYKPDLSNKRTRALWKTPFCEMEFLRRYDDDLRRRQQQRESLEDKYRNTASNQDSWPKRAMPSRSSSSSAYMTSTDTFTSRMTADSQNRIEIEKRRRELFKLDTPHSDDPSRRRVDSDLPTKLYDLYHHRK